MTAKSPVQRIDHRYDECGVEGVTLVGLPLAEWRGELLFDIANVKALHRVLYDAVARRPGRFTPQHLRLVRVGLRKTQGELASLIGRDLQTVGRWERGESPIDKAAEIVIRRMTLEQAGIGPLPSVEEIADLIAAPESEAGIRIDASDPDNYRLLPPAGTGTAPGPLKDGPAAPRRAGHARAPSRQPTSRAPRAAPKLRLGFAAGDLASEGIAPDRPVRPRKTLFLGTLLGVNAQAYLRQEGETVLIDLPRGGRVAQLFLGETPYTLVKGDRSRRYVVTGLEVGVAAAFLLRQSRDPAAYPADWR
jgi:DNA-binding transcriptional regulator YiaG